MKSKVTLLTIILFGNLAVFAQKETSRVTITNGTLEGVIENSGIRSFKGIPFAQPPVGELRWKEPQPVQNWAGIRKADHFGNKGMQKPIFGDMGFRAEKMSEDCLYLNVWTPAKNAKEHLPVLVYFYGGGMMAGDGSEPRYDGESMSEKGIVVLTVNYRLGIFGFLAHPELTKESPHHSSGNYGLLDQHEALKWVKKNIAAFGGDPDKITIAGESAGSISVSAQMASPLSKDLIAGAIGESGAMINPTMGPVSLADGENRGSVFAAKAGAASLADLRKIPADQLLDKSYENGMGGVQATIDGYFLPEFPVKIFAEGKQAHVPLLAGWNSAETSYQSLLSKNDPTPENYVKAINGLYGDKTEEVLKLYPGTTTEEVISSGTALASDRFIVYSTWKWIDLQSQTGTTPVYRYVFSKSKPGQSAGAPHAFEIEYAMGNLDYNKSYAWTADDHKVSETMETYFANFIKTGNPNGGSLPKWPAIKNYKEVIYINLGVETKAEKEQHRERYLFLDKEYTK